jgi:hypothetical protein
MIQHWVITTFNTKDLRNNKEHRYENKGRDKTRKKIGLRIGEKINTQNNLIPMSPKLHNYLRTTQKASKKPMIAKWQRNKIMDEFYTSH